MIYKVAIYYISKVNNDNASAITFNFVNKMLMLEYMFHISSCSSVYNFVVVIQFPFSQMNR